MPMKKVSQRSVARMLKAGKPLAGLLVGLSSTLGAAAERESPSPALMGAQRPLVTATNKVSEVRERPIRGRIAPPVRATEMPPAVPEGFYRVAYGDTLTKIAKKFGTTVGDLKRLNGFDDVRANALKAGEVIRIAPDPKPRQCPPPKPAPESKPPAPNNSANETDDSIIMGEWPMAVSMTITKANCDEAADMFVAAALSGASIPVRAIKVSLWDRMVGAIVPYSSGHYAFEYEPGFLRKLAHMWCEA